MTRHGQFLLQPESFRASADVPQWAHFPRLHLLLGWGPGIWDALDTAVFGLRHAFVPHPLNGKHPPIAGVMICRADYYQLSTTIREHAPTLVVEGVGADCVRYDFDDIGRPAARPAPCKHGKSHVIVPDGEYRVRHSFGDAGPTFTLERRTKALKKEYRDRLAALGLAYAPGVGKRDTKPDGLRDSAEQQFVEFVAKKKGEYVKIRTEQMVADKKVRPADFDERKAAHVRSRMGEMDRGKRDKKGVPKRPRTEEDLIRHTCGEIARREATDMLFDFGREDLFTLDANGFRNAT
jgi:hypothetical protein